MKVVDTFTCLGSTLSRTTKINDEVARHIYNASQAVGRQQNTVLNRHGLHLNAMLKMYKAVILPTLLYGAQIWMVYKKHTRRLNRFHPCCLRWILKLKWQDRTPGSDVLKRRGILSIYIMMGQL
nr:unnamed protein product [Spirometra erinaceieuropaei]